MQRLGGRIDHEFHLLQAFVVSLPESGIELLRQRPGVLAVEEDTAVQVLVQELPWGVDHIDAELVHGYNRGEGVRVAVIDTGIDLDHPDLSVASHVSFVPGAPTGNDDNGHGTHVAGTIGAVDNDIGVIGVAPGALVSAVKVLDSNGSGSWSNVIKGVEWSVDNGMQVANMSLGASSAPFAAELAMNAAYNAGVLLVAAAGNSGNRFGIGDNVTYPARFSTVIAVAATTQSDNRASFSSTGPAVEIAAPGVGVNSTFNDGGYRQLNGTSMASPHVAGVAALVIAGEAGLSVSDVRARLTGTDDDLPPEGRDNHTGHGLVDADEAAPEVANTPPVAHDDTANVQENGSVAIDVLANDTDADRDTLTVTNLSNPPNGTATLNADQTVQYTPDAEFTGNDAFTYTAFDGQDSSNLATVTVTVVPSAVNQPPVADAGPDQTAVVGQQVAFSGSGSTDVDGFIADYDWTFGDGSGAGGAAVTHTYTSAGVYTVVLKVTDDDGATDTNSATVSVSEPGPNSIHVAGIDMRLVGQFGGWRTFATAGVVVHDQVGSPASGVLVEGHWEGATSDSDSRTTGSSGRVTLRSNVLRKPASGTTFTFVVDGLSKADFTYNAGDNVETEDSVAVP